MPSKFGYNIRTLTATSFLNEFKKQGQYEKWATATAYSIGDRVFNGLHRYIATATGTDDTTGPVHTSGIDSTSDCNWLYVDTQSTSEIFRNNQYIFFGKKTDWVSELEKANPITTDSNAHTIISDIMTLEKLTDENIRLGIKRNTWASGTIYSQYDPTKDPYLPAINGGYEHPFYCISGNYIYKCLNNNNGAITGSTVALPDNAEPENDEIIITEDDYAWKYMGLIDSAEDTSFGTPQYVPINILLSDDNSKQWDVQAGALTNGISSLTALNTVGDIDPSAFSATVFLDDFGKTVDSKNIAGGRFAIERITSDSVDPVEPGTFNNCLISNCGTGYVKDNIVMFIHSQAAGSGAYTYPSDSDEAEKVIISNGIIQSVTLAALGNGYNSNAKLILVGEPVSGQTITPATLSLSVTPGGGPIIEVTVNSGGANYARARVFIIPGPPNTVVDYESFGGAITEIALTPLRGHGFNLAKELAANVLLCNIETPATTGDNDAYVKGSANTIRQFGIITDITDKTTGEYVTGDLYIGPAHTAYSNEQSLLHKISNNSGDILYLSNFDSIIRSDGTSENITVAIVF